MKSYHDRVLETKPRRFYKYTYCSFHFVCERYAFEQDSRNIHRTITAIWFMIPFALHGTVSNLLLLGRSLGERECTWRMRRVECGWV